MPEEKKEKQLKVSKSMKDLKDLKNPSVLANKVLLTPEGKKLVDELQKIQNELEEKGLKLEDRLILGNKTLKESVKNWDKKNFDKNAVVQYAALCIGACNHKEIPVTYIGLETDRKFNQSDVLGGKKEEKEKQKDGQVNPSEISGKQQDNQEEQIEEDSLWDWFWDWICAAVGITTTHAKDVQLREHIKQVDKVRTANLQTAFLNENKESYQTAKETVDKIRAEEKNWLELFFDSEIPPEIPEKMKQKLVDQLYPELREMSPLDACMKMAAAQIGFSEDMTPDTLRNDQEKLAILRQIGKDYNTIIQTGDAERLKSEVSHKTKPMKFTGLISAMETAAQKPGEYPYIQKEGKKYFNENYNPLNDDKVKEKIIKAAPILKAFSYGSADENSGLGAMLAKETLETLDYSVRAYEALEKKDYDMTLRFSNIAVKHMVQSTILQGYSAFGDIGRYLIDNKGMYSRIHNCSIFDGCGLRYSLKLDNIFKNQNGHRLLSPIGSSMLLIQNGLKGNVSKYSTLVDPKTSKGIELRYGFLDNALHLDYEELKKATRAEINKADIAALKLENAQDMEKNNQNDASKNEPEIVLS